MEKRRLSLGEVEENETREGEVERGSRAGRNLKRAGKRRGREREGKDDVHRLIRYPDEAPSNLVKTHLARRLPINLLPQFLQRLPGRFDIEGLVFRFTEDGREVRR